LLGNRGNVIGLDPIEHPYQQLDQEVISPSGVEGYSFGGGFVALGRSTRSGSGATRSPLMSHLEISVVGQAIEMMPGDVGVDREEFCDLGAGHSFRTLSNREIDAPAGGIT
jgi:hypothetical protein